MRYIPLFSSFLFLLLQVSTSFALPQQSLVPGGIAVIELDRTDKTPNFKFKGKPVLISQQAEKYIAVVGLSLSLKAGE